MHALDIDSWLKFAIFMAASAWLTALGLGGFYGRRWIIRMDREKKHTAAHHKTNSHAAEHAHRGPNGEDYPKHE